MAEASPAARLPWLRWVTAATLLTLALGVADAALGGQLEILLHPTFRPLSWVAAIALLVLAFACCSLPCPEMKPARQAGSWFRTTLSSLAVGFFVIALQTAPPAFSDQAIANRGLGDLSFVMEVWGKRLDRMEQRARQAHQTGLPLDVDLLDVTLAANQPETRAAVQGERVRLLGQLLTPSPESEPEEPSSEIERSGFKLARLFMWCCAADATPLGVWVSHDPSASPVPQADWLWVTGRLEFERLSKGEPQLWRAFILLENAEAAATPKEPFLY